MRDHAELSLTFLIISRNKPSKTLDASCLAPLGILLRIGPLYLGCLIIDAVVGTTEDTNESDDPSNGVEDEESYRIEGSGYTRGSGFTCRRDPGTGTL